MDDNIVVIITDASVVGSTKGPGGWACQITDGDSSRLESGWFAGFYSNNEMELLAIFMGLLLAPPGRQVLIWTDSKTALKWINGMGARRTEVRDLKRHLFDLIYHAELRIFGYEYVSDLTNPDLQVVHQAAYNAAQEAYRYLYRL